MGGRRPPRPAACGGWLVLALLAGASPLAAQGRSALAGVVISDRAGAPLPGATIRIQRASGRDTTLVADAKGRFELRRLPAGSYWVTTQWQGITSPLLAIDLREGERFEAEFTVRAAAPELAAAESVTVLPDLESRAAPVRTSTFEQRRLTGMGLYITQDQIERREAATLNDVLRNAQGVRITCGREGCMPMLNRAPFGCAPAFYIDDMAADARTATNIRSTELHGIEIYEGLSQLPAELVRDRLRARCGVIAVWTRRGPEAPPRPPTPPR